MTINDVYVLCQYAVNKNQSGNLTPSQFDTVINQGQRSFVDYMLGQFEDYLPSHPLPKVQYGQNEIVRQRLTPIIYDYRLSIDAAGRTPYPGDYLQTDAMYSIYNFNKIKFVQQDRLASNYNSVIDPVATNPIYLIKSSGFQFYPASIGSADLSYVRVAPNMHWGYVNDAQGRPIYSAIHSTQPVWDDAAMFEIIIRALAIVGVNLQSGVLLQYTQEIKKAGQ